MKETDTRPERAVYYQERAAQVIKNLEKRLMSGLYAATAAGAVDAVLALIPPGALVARGDSLTLAQLGVPEAIKERGQNELLDPFETDDDGNWPPEDLRDKMMLDTFSSDVFIAGTNAVTLDGKLVNVDGSGNRVAAMIYGPKKVILVVGANKIVENAEEGRQRIRDIAAPLNSQRHLLHHHDASMADLPCVKTGVCADCKQPYRICNYVVTIEGAMAFHEGRITVVIVGEELGL
jgi:hypothetical protein